MNYLAHVTLAEPTDDARLGSLLGDFRRGLEPERFPAATRYALEEHRALDAWFDALDETRTLRRTFPQDLVRFGGILIDVFVDHALVRHWDELVGRPDGLALAGVTESLYRALDTHASALPPRLARIAPRMARDDWLQSYGDLENVERALEGIASRLSRTTPIARGIVVLRERRPEFDAFARDVLPRTRAWLAERRRADGRTMPEQ